MRTLFMTRLGCIVLLLSIPVTARGQDKTEQLEARIRQLQDQLRVLEQEVRSLRSQSDRASQPSPTSGKEQSSADRKSPAVNFGDRGLSVESGGEVRLNVRGYFQADSRTYLGDARIDANRSFLLRRIRPVLELTVFRDFEFRLMPDFAGDSATLFDAYFNWRILPEVQILAGKVKSPTGLERLQSATALMFPERGLPTSLVPNRDIGVELHGNLLDDRLEYALGIFNGTTDGGSVVTDVDDGKDTVARVFARPFTSPALKGLGIGLAGTYGKHEGTPSRYRTTGQQTFLRFAPGTANDGRVWRFTPQGYYYYGPFGVLAEWAVSSQRLRNGEVRGDIRNHAWQVMGSVVLTGEENSYRGLRPRRSLNPSEGAWGAFEVVARAGRLAIDEEGFPVFASPVGNADKALNLGIGLNWYPNRSVKFSVDYEVNRLSGGGLEDEHTLFNRVQFAF
ncbi:MAG TPA: porin [Acidobacteriota bacterium]|nr:porin [Acidobacteriota bacterium]